MQECAAVNGICDANYQNMLRSSRLEKDIMQKAHGNVILGMNIISTGSSHVLRYGLNACSTMLHNTLLLVQRSYKVLLSGAFRSIDWIVDIVHSVSRGIRNVFAHLSTNTINSTIKEFDVLNTIKYTMHSAANKIGQLEQGIMPQLHIYTAAQITKLGRLGLRIFHMIADGIRVTMKLGTQWGASMTKRVVGVSRTLYAYVASSYGFRQATSTKISTLASTHQMAAKRKQLPSSTVEQLPMQPQPKMVSAIVEAQSNLEKLLVQLKWRPDFGEAGLQYVLNLLNVELFITEYLLKGDNSFMLQEAVTKRIRLIEQSSPSVVYVYNMILDFATTTDAHKMREHYTQDKKMFLWNVKSKLELYYGKIQEMQYDLSVALAG